MLILYGHVELMLPYSASLKEKRMVIQSILSRINKRVNISISEAAYQDLWQRSVLGFAAVCSVPSQTDMLLAVISDVLDQHEDNCEVIDLVYEIIQHDF